MRFEWDIRKNQSNRAKHGVRFDVAELVFQDPLRREFDSQLTGDEERWISIGRLPTGQLLYVVTTQREEAGEDVIRIISARKVTTHERRAYEERT